MKKGFPDCAQLIRKAFWAETLPARGFGPWLASPVPGDEIQPVVRTQKLPGTDCLTPLAGI